MGRQVKANDRRGRWKPVFRYRMKAPDGTIRTAVGDESYFAVWSEIESQFGKNTPRLILPLEMVSSEEGAGR